MGAQVVYVVEGEKAVDRLRSLGLVATCGPAGASSWKRESSFELLSAGCRELVILADHDQAGERHAERVAVDITAVESDGSIAVKVVHLPGLAPSGDVVDFLEAGRDDLDDLLAVVAQTPAWSPGLRERQRTEMLREQAKIRMRKHRAKLPPSTCLRPRWPPGLMRMCSAPWRRHSTRLANRVPGAASAHWSWQTVIPAEQSSAPSRSASTPTSLSWRAATGEGAPCSTAVSLTLTA